MELRTTHRELPHPDRVIVHRKGVPGNEEEEHLAYELRCYPNTAQVRAHPRPEPSALLRRAMSCRCSDSGLPVVTRGHVMAWTGYRRIMSS
jgi:hypothetical protein